MNCPQCGTKLKPWVFDVGYGVKIPSSHCTKCQFNVTDESVLDRRLGELRSRMQKQAKVVAVGEGLGVRFPKEIVEHYAIKKGAKVTIKPGKKGLEIML